MTIPVDSSWTLTFDEEFNGTSLDTDVWGTNWLGTDGAITKPINSAELAAYDPAQVSVSDGSLHLTAVASPVTVNGTEYDYRSGIVQIRERRAARRIDERCARVKAQRGCERHIRLCEPDGRREITQRQQRGECGALGRGPLRTGRVERRQNIAHLTDRARTRQRVEQRAKDRLRVVHRIRETRREGRQ